MRVLALDTTTRAGSVALVVDDRIVEERAGDPSRGHAERLPGELVDVAAAHGVALRDVDLFAVASGPGSFTGLRIGLAAIQGLALALGLPVVGVSALDALALAAGPHLRDAAIGTLLVWRDAQRGEVFAGRYAPEPLNREGHWTAAGDATVGTPAEQLAAEVPSPRLAFAGDGSISYRDLLARWSPASPIVEPLPALAPTLITIGRRRAAEGHAASPHALQPLYVRRPDAEIERLRHGTR